MLICVRSPDVQTYVTREPISSLLSSAQSRLAQLGIDPMQADVEAHYQWIETVASRVSMLLDELAAIGTPAPASAANDVAAPHQLEYQSKPRHLSEKIDAILIHKIW